MTGFEFVEEPPEAGRGVRKAEPLLVEFAAALKARPGEWAKWPKPTSFKVAASLASRINNCTGNVPQAFRDGPFEAVSRSGQVYVRAKAEPTV